MDIGGGRVRQLTLGPLSLPDPAGVEEHGQWPPGFPGNLRDPDVSIEIPDEEAGTPDLLAPGGPSTTEGSEQRAERWYRLANHRASREGRRGVGASHNIAEAGEPSRGTPWREGDAMS